MYEGEVLHLLEPLLLPERQQVTVTISETLEIAGNHPLLVSSEEWAEAALQDVPLEEVRRPLGGLRGTLSEAVIEERRDR